MMPICPATLSNWLSRVVARFNPHVWHETFFLPAGKIFSNNCLDTALTCKIIICDGSKEGFLPIFAERCLGKPLNAIKPFLENVLRTWHEIGLFPEPQAIPDVSISITIITTNGLDFDP